MSTVVVNRNLDSGMFGSGTGTDLSQTMVSPLDSFAALPFTFGELVPPPNTPVMKPLKLNTAICTIDQSEVGPAIDKVEIIQIGKNGEVVNNKQSGTTHGIAPNSTNGIANNATANTDSIVVEVVEIGSDDEEDDDYPLNSPPPPSPDIEHLTSDPFAQADALDAKREEDLADLVPTNSPIDEYYPDIDDRADYFSRPPKPTATAGWDAQSPAEVRRAAVTTAATATTTTTGTSIRFALKAGSSNGSNNVNSSIYAINKLIKRKVAPVDATLTRAWSAPSLMTKLAQAMKPGQEWEQEEKQEEQEAEDSATDLEKELYVPPTGADLAGLDTSAMTLALLRAEWNQAVRRGYAPVSHGPSRNIPAEVTATIKRSYTSPPGQWTMGKPDDSSSDDGSDGMSDDIGDDQDDVQTVVAERKDAETEAE